MPPTAARRISKALIEAAHERGLMVLLDVVYNHFGPDGNYLPGYAPQFFTDRHQTPWGAAHQYDGPTAGPVREFFIDNALYWIEEYHLDGLRLDAVHAIIDDSPKHVLDELAERVRAETADRHVHLVLENEENEARRLARGADGKPLLLHRAVERRRPPRAARGGDRRGTRLLCRIPRRHAEARPRRWRKASPSRAR